MVNFVRRARIFFQDGFETSAIGSMLSALVVKAVSTAATFAVAVYLARYLGASGYGLYSFALTVITLIAIPIQSGMSHLVVRETARFIFPRDVERLNQLILWTLRLVVLLFAALLLAGICAWIWGAVENGSGRLVVFGVGAILIVTLPLTSVQGSALRGLGFGVVGQIPDTVVRHLTFFFLLLIFFGLLDFSATPQAAMVLHGSASCLALLVAGLLFRRHRPLAKAGSPEPVLNRQALPIDQAKKTWSKALVALVAVSGLQLLNGSISILVLGWLGSDEEVGIFRIIIQLNTLVIFGLVAINPVLHGRFSRLFMQDRTAELQSLATYGSRLCLAVAIIPLVGLFFWGEELLQLIFGAPYDTGFPALRIYLIGQMINVSFGAVGGLLNMTGHQSDTIKGMGLAVLLNIVLSFVLTPIYGIYGTAIATTVSTGVWNLLLWGVVWYRLRIDSSILGIRCNRTKVSQTPTSM